MELKRFSLQNKEKESYKITKIYNDKVLLLENNSNSFLRNISDLDAFIKSTNNIISNLHSRDGIEHIHTDNMIKLYHVTLNYTNEPDYKVFKPRISESAPRMEGICSFDFNPKPYFQII